METIESLKQKCRELDSDNGNIRSYAAELERKLAWNDVNDGLPKPCEYESRYDNLCLVISDRGHYKYEALAYYGQDISQVVFDPKDVEWHVLTEEHYRIVDNSNITHYFSIPKY